MSKEEELIEITKTRAFNTVIQPRMSYIQSALTKSGYLLLPLTGIVLEYAISAVCIIPYDLTRELVFRPRWECDDTNDLHSCVSTGTAGVTLINRFSPLEYETSPSGIHCSVYHVVSSGMHRKYTINNCKPNSDGMMEVMHTLPPEQTTSFGVDITRTPPSATFDQFANSCLRAYVELNSKYGLVIIGFPLIQSPHSVRVLGDYLKTIFETKTDPLDFYGQLARWKSVDSVQDRASFNELRSHFQLIRLFVNQA